MEYSPTHKALLLWNTSCVDLVWFVRPQDTHRGKEGVQILDSTMPPHVSIHLKALKSPGIIIVDHLDKALAGSRYRSASQGRTLFQRGTTPSTDYSAQPEGDCVDMEVYSLVSAVIGFALCV
jgi:hypothetical protein